MVGIVIVSHSAALADAVVELAGEMGGGQVRIEAAGGMSEPAGALGTDFELVRAAIDRAASPDGVLVLMDLGSAVMTAEMAAETATAENGTRVLLCEAPLVEGAVAAAARAGAGAPLDEVAEEARSALGMKRGQLGLEEDETPAAAGPPAADDAETVRLPVSMPLGLHARPAARIVATVGRFDAHVTLTDETTGHGPADTRSLTALITLGVRHNDTLLATATGPDASDVLAALTALAAEAFGDAPAAGEGSVARAADTASAADGGASSGGAAAATPGEDVAAPPPGTVLRGVSAGVGIAIGPIAPLRPVSPQAAIPDEPDGDPGAERARLDLALAGARREIEEARERIGERVGEAEARIFDVQLLLLDDAELRDPVHAAVAEGKGAAAAWAEAVRAVAATYSALDDPYLRERAADVEDVGQRVLRALVGRPAPAAPATGIVVAADLAPSDAAALDPSLVFGVATARGGATAHAAILARALGIPAVVGLGEALLAIPAGATVVLDAAAGLLTVDPPPDDLAAHERDRAAAEARRLRARDRAPAPATTRDGTTIEVGANIGAAHEAAAAVTLGADGVGLLRTEFLFLDRATAPTVAEQQQVYAEIVAALDGRPLIVRTLDAGADKPLPFAPTAAEDNPFLGVRGIRFGLARPDLLRTQLEAIANVAADGDVRVMFPMVATLAEYRAARALLEAACIAANAPPIPAGIMVEVPATAVAAERFAREVDFFSIGTNDLTQYTMAADRGNAQVADLLAGPLPPVLRLVAAVVEGAKAHGRWVGVCGELAGDPAAAILLAGLGVDELSMAAPLVAEVKEALRTITLADARTIARGALDLDTADAARAAVAPLLAAAGDH